MKLMSRSAADLDVLLFDLMQEEENEGEDDNISGLDSESDGEQADKRKVLTSRGNFAPPVFAHLLQHLCLLLTTHIATCHNKTYVHTNPTKWFANARSSRAGGRPTLT